MISILQNSLSEFMKIFKDSHATNTMSQTAYYTQILFEQYLCRIGIIFTAGIMVGLLISLGILAFLNQGSRFKIPKGRAFEVKKLSAIRKNWK
jgi:hypothetical protein